MPHKHPRLPKKALGAALGAVLSGLVLTNSQAQALVVTVDGQDWEVTTFPDRITIMRANSQKRPTVG